MLFRPNNTSSSVDNVNSLPSSIPIPIPADNPTIIASFTTHYAQNLSRPTALEPFTLFASLQRPELLKRASVNAESMYPIQPISTDFGIIDETIINELSEEFWQSLDEGKRAQWKWLANDIQRLCDDVNIESTCRINQGLLGEWSDATETVLTVGWINMRVQRITTKCLLRSPKTKTTPVIDVNSPWVNEAGTLPSGNRERDPVDMDALYNEVFSHWTNQDWSLPAAAAATVESQSPAPCHIPTPESMNGDMELEYGSESPSKYIASELESSDTNPELELECESELDEC